METWSTGMTKVGPMEVKKNHEFFFSKGPDFSRYSHRIRRKQLGWGRGIILLSLPQKHHGIDY